LVNNNRNLCPDIQNELISIAAIQIREDICREAAGAAIMAIMVDDTKEFHERSR